MHLREGFEPRLERKERKEGSSDKNVEYIISKTLQGAPIMRLLGGFYFDGGGIGRPRRGDIPSRQTRALMKPLNLRHPAVFGLLWFPIGSTRKLAAAAAATSNADYSQPRRLQLQCHN